MRDNGSPAPRFDFDEERTYFRVTLPVHPGYRVLHALRESGHLWVTGERRDALAHLRRTFDQQPGSGALAEQMIEYAMELGDVDAAREVLDRFHSAPNKSEPLRPYIRMTMRLLDHGLEAEARQLLNRSAPMELGAPASEAAELAILRKRAGDLQEAHRLFRQAFEGNKDDPRFVHEFAQTKARLAGQTRDRVERKRLNQEAEALLKRVLQLTQQPARVSWCWFDLAQVMSWLRAPVADIEAAFHRAIELGPTEARFKAGYEQWKRREAARRRR
jgi:ATP-dependent DNA helicase RecG